MLILMKWIMNPEFFIAKSANLLDHAGPLDEIYSDWEPLGGSGFTFEFDNRCSSVYAYLVCKMQINF